MGGVDRFGSVTIMLLTAKKTRKKKHVNKKNGLGVGAREMTAYKLQEDATYTEFEGKRMCKRPGFE